MKPFPQEVQDFIVANYKGILTRELVELINQRFGTNYSYEQIGNFKSKRKLKSGAKGRPYYSKRYPKEICEYISSNCNGVGPKEMACKLNQQFGTDYTVAQINSFYGNHKISSGLTGRFPKGNIPFNKGKKGYYAPGSEKGWFKKGCIPHTHKPVGTEVLRADGYWWVKVAEPNKWCQKHVIVWEAEHGKRPADHVVTFLDGDRSNFSLDNLVLITRSVHAIMARGKYRSTNADHTRIGIVLAQIEIARSAAKRKLKQKKR